MFTNIAKGILWFFIIVGILFSLIAGGGACSQNGSFWWIAPAGIVVTLISCTAMGVVVELADNVAECKHYLRIIANGGNVSEGEKPTTPANRSTGLFKNLDITAQTNTAPTAAQSSSLASLWKCPECGEENDKYSLFCVKCGKHKPR